MIRATQLRLEKIRTDGGTQVRAEIDAAVVGEYAEHLDELPAGVAFFDGSDHWLADGFHRLEAHKLAGRKAMPVEIRQGTRRDAILHACGANAAHGLRRTNADKRAAVLRMVEDPEWSTWSNSKVAIACRVDDKTVAKIRSERQESLNFGGNGPAHLRNSEDSPASALAVPDDARAKIQALESSGGRPRLVERGGTVYAQDTANIGPRKPTADAPPEPRTPTPEPAAPPTDADGAPLPDRADLREAFAGRERIAHVLALHQQLVIELGKLWETPAAAVMSGGRRQSIEASYRAARHEISASMPHALCPKCRGATRQCHTCAGRGWISTEQARRQDQLDKATGAKGAA